MERVEQEKEEAGVEEGEKENKRVQAELEGIKAQLEISEGQRKKDMESIQNLESDLKQEREGRVNDEQEFHNEIMKILDQFEKFHSSYAQLEAKYQQQTKDFHQFIHTVRVGIDKIAQDLSV